MARRLGKLLAGAVAVAVVVLAGSASQAYVAVKGGYFMPNDDSEGLENWDDGFGGELAIGGQLADTVAIEGGAGYWTTKPDGGDDLRLGIVPVTVTAKLLVDAGVGLTLYVGGGAGLYWALLSGDATEGLSNDDKQAAGFGVHAVAGLEVPLPALSIIAEIRWSKADVEFGSSDDATNVGGLTALVGLKF